EAAMNGAPKMMVGHLPCHAPTRSGVGAGDAASGKARETGDEAGGEEQKRTGLRGVGDLGAVLDARVGDRLVDREGEHVGGPELVQVDEEAVVDRAGGAA